MFVSNSSLQSDVKWQVVRPTIRCGRGVCFCGPSTTTTNLCVSVYCRVSGQTMLGKCVYMSLRTFICMLGQEGLAKVRP